MQVAVFALLARSLGVDLFGSFSIVVASSLFALALLDLGMGTRVLKGGTGPDDRGALTTFALLRAASIIAIPLVAAYLASLNGAGLAIYVAAAVYAVGEATGDVAVGIKQGERHSLFAMIVLLSRRALPLLILIVFPGEVGAACALFAAGLAGAVWFFVLVLTHLSKPMSLWVLVRQNLGIIASGGASNFAQLDVTLVGITLGAAGAGLYGASTRLGNPLNLAVTTMLQVVIPEMSAIDSRQRRVTVFRRVRRVVFLAAIVIAAGAFFAPYVVELLYGPDFAGATPVAIAVFLCSAISAVAQVHLSWFYASHVPLFVPGAMWVAVALGLASILALSASFGIVGAAVGLVLMHALTALAIIIPCIRSIAETGERK